MGGDGQVWLGMSRHELYLMLLLFEEGGIWALQNGKTKVQIDQLRDALRDLYYKRLGFHEPGT